MQLIYIENIGQEVNGNNIYNFYFSDNIKNINPEWNYDINGLTNPDKPKYYKLIKVLKASIPLLCVQNNMCMGMMHAVDGVTALAFENIADYDEYPEDGRLVFYFGENINNVNEKLENKNINFE